MTSILKKIKHRYAFLLALFICPLIVAAQGLEESQTLSVSPTLFEMQANPSQSWTSQLRVVNVNDYPLTVYPQPVNFAPLGEDGRGDLIPIFAEETQGQTLAEWITVPADPVIIPPQATAEIPISVRIPEQAAPGGHYAAILVGTKPPHDGETLSQVQTAQFVTSLFFVRVSGDVVESGDIREFMASKAIVQTPEATLFMRFENDGNVHVQPQGDIKIFNMWGKERGFIPINHQTHFGNVLPNSIRKFTFTWSSDTAVYDIGRYRAVATLGYGEEGKKFVTSTTYFWVIPYTTILITLLILYVSIKIILWLIRRYIDRMLALSGVNVHEAPYIPHHARQAQTPDRTMVVKRYANVGAPMRASAKEILDSWHQSHGLQQKISALWRYVFDYRFVLLGLLVVCGVFVGIYLAVLGIVKDATHYQVSVDNAGEGLTLSSEDIAYEKLRQTKIKPETKTEQLVPIRIINISGQAGAAAKAKFSLEEAGYAIEAITIDESRSEQKSIVVYPPGEEQLALQLRNTLGTGLLSAQTDAHEKAIIIYAGTDSLTQ
ncbi:MAG: hypothetical protein RLZZ360_81 [Candidatus Parcubacteria bacterium]|jgi:hypothetical protein